jgi:hypothetical protein
LVIDSTINLTINLAVNPAIHSTINWLGNSIIWPDFTLQTGQIDVTLPP